MKEDKDFQIRFRLSAGNALMKDLRKKRNLYQVDIARALGVSKEVIGHIEQCRNYPNIELGTKIAEFLGTNFETLFPAWLQAFTESWKRANTIADVSYESISLDAPEVLALPSGERDVLESVDASLRSEALRRIVEQLPPRLRDILNYRYGLEDGIDHSLEETGREFSITRERVRQVETRAMEMIRDKVWEGKAIEIAP